MKRNEIKAEFIEELSDRSRFRNESTKDVLFSCALDSMHAYYNSIGDPDYQGHPDDIYR